MKSLSLLINCMCIVFTFVCADNEHPNYAILNYGDDLVFSCKKTNPTQTVKWRKNGNEIDDSDDITIANNDHDLVANLTIHYASNDDIADYSCLVEGEDNPTNFKVIAKPYVKLPDDVSVTEGETLTLECSVIGTYPITIGWIFGNKTYNESSDRVKISTDYDEDGEIKNNVFELESVEMSDRGYIGCTAYNIATQIEKPNEAQAFIRIRGKNAAYWPFLGIIIQTIILCFIIFIYEKRCKSDEPEDSDSDDSTEKRDVQNNLKNFNKRM